MNGEVMVQYYVRCPECPAKKEYPRVHWLRTSGDSEYAIEHWFELQGWKRSTVGLVCPKCGHRVQADGSIKPKRAARKRAERKTA